MDLRELQRALRRKLEASEDRKGDHVFFCFSIGGAEHRVAKFSHSARGQLPEFVIADTAKRLKLSKSELEGLVDCPLTSEGFLELWNARAG